jgi:hypothetical protein
MISSEVQRTLVKSPPELWAELSDPAALARHLGDLGEIRITRVEPEKTVEWEAADTTGKVLLKPSGWGTKVTLSVTRQAVAPAAEPMESIAPAKPVLTDEPVAEAEPESESVVEPVVAEEPETEPAAAAAEPPAVEPVVEEPLAAEPPPEEPVATIEPETRPGFFARLFRRRPKDQTLSQTAVEPELTIEAEPDPEPEIAPSEQRQPEAIEIVEPGPISTENPPREEAPSDIPDIAAELKAAEEAATEEVTAVLTAALDRLGAAHHRPFSRA